MCVYVCACTCMSTMYNSMHSTYVCISTEYAPVYICTCMSMAMGTCVSMHDVCMQGRRKRKGKQRFDFVSQKQKNSNLNSLMIILHFTFWNNKQNIL